jgi:hypothetical protein
MKRSILAIALLTIPAAAQHDHNSGMNTRGAHVMGFSQQTTTHHFTLTFDGGIIDVRANEAKDTKSRDQIRSHFHHIAQSFSAGDFSDPFFVHATSVPGTATMKQQKDQLHWDVQQTPGGARLIITADNKPTLDALHDFLRFQIEDHKTGDCEIPH